MNTTELLAPLLTALLGLLLPGVIRYTGKRIEKQLNGNNAVVMAALEAMNARVAAIEATQSVQIVDIAFLKGVQSERAQTAQAAVIAAALVPRPLRDENQPAAG